VDFPPSSVGQCKSRTDSPRVLRIRGKCLIVERLSRLVEKERIRVGSAVQRYDSGSIRSWIAKGYITAQGDRTDRRPNEAVVRAELELMPSMHIRQIVH